MTNANEPYTAIQVVMMPRDTNPFGTIFGGVILSYIDVAGSIGARHAVAQWGGPSLAFVTVAINRVEFKQPVLVGDVMRFLTSVVRVGTTSITIKIQVVAERGATLLAVTEAEAVYVGVDASLPPDQRRPVPLR